MSKKLIFADGVSFDTDDSSNANRILIYTDTFAKADDVKLEFTQENLIGATLNDKRLENLVPVSIQALYDAGSIIEVHLNSRTLNDIEIANKQITELQEAVAEIAGGVI